jgi:hypothetical protein
VTGCDRCSKWTSSANLTNGNTVCWNAQNLTTSATKWAALATKKHCSISFITTASCFYRPGLFGDRIILDQNWALEAIYAFFDRKKILLLLRGYERFSWADLQALLWSGQTSEE